MTDSKELIERLRGKYAIGPRGADGEPEFGYRQFDKPPIQEEAATHIAALEARVDAGTQTIATLRADLAKAVEENRLLSAGSCDVEGGKLCDERGNAYCTLQLKLAKAVDGLEKLTTAIDFEVPPIIDGIEIERRALILADYSKRAQSLIKELKP